MSGGSETRHYRRATFLAFLCNRASTLRLSLHKLCNSSYSNRYPVNFHGITSIHQPPSGKNRFTDCHEFALPRRSRKNVSSDWRLSLGISRSSDPVIPEICVIASFSPPIPLRSEAITIQDSEQRAMKTRIAKLSPLFVSLFPEKRKGRKISSSIRSIARSMRRDRRGTPGICVRMKHIANGFNLLGAAAPSWKFLRDCVRLVSHSARPCYRELDYWDARRSTAACIIGCK